MHKGYIKVWDSGDECTETGNSIMRVIPFHDDSIPYQIVEENLIRLEKEIPEFSDTYIDNAFENFLDIYFDNEQNFKLLSWLHDIGGMDLIIKNIDISNKSDLLDILIKEYPNRVKLDTNKKHYLKHCSMYIPADDVAKEYDIKISKNESASDKWQKIFDELSLDEIRKIMEENNIDLKTIDLDLFKQQFIRYSNFDYSKVFDYFFYSEEEQWKTMLFAIEKIEEYEGIKF